MRAAFLALPVALVALIAAAPALAQLGGGKPIYPRVGAGVATMIAQDAKSAEASSFDTLHQFYAHVAKKRGLADPESDGAVAQIKAHASVQHLHDYSGDSIVVVKVDPARADEEASFFVLREKESHLRLLGEMMARSYESSTSSGHLEFVLDLGRVAPPPRYQVDGNFLINLADLASLDRNDPVELDVRNGF
jgi:hypothetical protein